MMIIGPFMIFNFFDRKQTLRSYEYDFSSSVVCIGFAWRYVIVERHQKIISVSPKIPLLKVIFRICKRSICKGFCEITFLRVIIAWHLLTIVHEKYQTVAQGVPCQYCCHPAAGALPPKHCESVLSQQPELQSSLQ